MYMNISASEIRKSIKSVLQRQGLYAPVSEIIRRLRFFRSRKYHDIKSFSVRVNNSDVKFSTEDDYSNSWFFPRYAGSKLHEKPVTERLLAELNCANCFVDVGANLGWYTCLACRQMPEGVVYGFEMDDLNFALLKNNIAINGFTNVEVFNLAVFDSSGETHYQRSGDRPNSNFTLRLDNTVEKDLSIVSVGSITLDEFFEEKSIVPDVVKIDVEGAEMNVLKGMTRILAEDQPTLFLEVHPYNFPGFKTSSDEILSFLNSRGYTVSEIENMRGQVSSGRIRALPQETKLKNNPMLYAVVENKNEL